VKHIGKMVYENTKNDHFISLTECGEIDIKNGIIESISSNGSVLTTSCVTDYQTNTHTSVCQTNGTWSNDITCATSGNYRIFSGLICLMYSALKCGERNFIKV
jgi:hypothetical protein